MYYLNTTLMLIIFRKFDNQPYLARSILLHVGLAGSIDVKIRTKNIAGLFSSSGGGTNV
jgi:hypothetical protein